MKSNRGAGTLESIIILALFVAVGCCLLRCTAQQVLPIKAAAQEVLTNCPLGITVRECLHRLIDDATHYPEVDGGTK